MEDRPFTTGKGVSLGRDVEATWREAKAGGCTDDLWMELASKREREHPEGALIVYQGQVEPLLARKNNEAYREGIGLLRKIRGLMARVGKETELPPIPRSSPPESQSEKDLY